MAKLTHAEDIVLSEAARAAGPLYVDPALRVEHHRSPESRLPKVATAYTTIRNTAHVLELRKASGWAYLALHWSTLGLVAKDILQPRRHPLVRAYLRALRDVNREVGRWGRGKGRNLGRG